MTNHTRQPIETGHKLADLAAIPGFTYLATPYTKYWAGINCAAYDASVITGQLMDMGLRVFSPIVHSHHVAVNHGLDPLDPQYWLEADAAFVEAASSLVVATMKGWDESFGVAHEIAMFKAAGKPIVLYNPVGL